MKIPFCSPPQAKRFVQYLHSRYGIPLVIMKEWRWIQHRESVFIVFHEAGEWSRSTSNLFSLGLQAFTNAKTFEPTSNFITLIGKHVRQNIVELSEEQLSLFFNHKNVSREYISLKKVLSNGWVAVSFEGKTIGSASLNANHLIPNLPGGHHGEENE